MNAKEIDGVFHCDCGFSWSRGKNGSHNCADGLREKVQQLAAENVALKAAISAVNRTAEECELNGDELKYVVEPSEFEALTDLLDETPATDRIAAGIKADGVDSGIKTIITMLNHQAPGVSDAINVLRVHSSELREVAK